EELGLSPVYVRGVATFYTMYNKAPVGTWLVQVCTNVCCNICGADEVMQAFLEHTGTEPGEISDDGLFTCIPAECLGACGFPTVVQVNERYFENVTPEDVPAILERLRRAAMKQVRWMACRYRKERGTRVLTEAIGDTAARSIERWKKYGGDEARRKALGMAPNDVIEVVKASGLRGRGGAGFPTGVKWSFMPKDDSRQPHYLLINADESEPGAFKDRELLRWTPHQVIEGALIGAHAIRAKHVYIYMRGE